MSVILLGFAVFVVLFILMVVALAVGRRLGLKRLARDPDGARAAGSGVVDSAVFALLGLLIAFTFTGAAGRFDTRRQLVADEANDVGTAWLRLDLLPAEDQPALRELFREYLQQRIDAHALLPDVVAATRAEEAAVALTGRIWTLACASVAKDGRTQVATLVLPALNSMFDIAGTRAAVIRLHVPGLIIGTLIALALLAAVLAGSAMASGGHAPRLHLLGFAFIMAMTLYVIIDLEFPRAGMIRLDDTDRPMLELRDAFK